MCLRTFCLVISVCTLHLIVCVHASGETNCCQNFGLKVPDRNCLLDWEQFTSSVANVTWKALYGLTSFPNETVPTPGLKTSIRWELFTNLALSRKVAYWNGPGNSCVYGENTFAAGECTKVAKLEALEDEESLLRLAALRFVSTNPDKYVIYSFCLDDDLKCSGYCQIAYIGVLVKDQRPDTDGDGHPDGDMILDGIPWCDIENKLNECFDASMASNTTYTQLQWIWRGSNECRIGDQN